MSIPPKPVLASTSVSSTSTSTPVNMPNIPKVPTINSNTGKSDQVATLTTPQGMIPTNNTGMPMNFMNFPMNMPGMPSIQGLPGVSQMPMMNMPQMNMPNMPTMPNMPNMPTMPNMHTMPTMPTMPTMTNIGMQMPNIQDNVDKSDPLNNFDPTIVMKQNQLIQQVNAKAANRTHFAFEPFLNKEYNFGLDPDRPTCEYWIQSNGTSCPLGSECPLKHPSKGFKNKIVCKYWLRGLCKMGDNCDFLHEYNLSRMPECAYYAATGVCTQGPECVYSHVDAKSKIPECWNYTNMGFCPDGPKCSKRHIRREMCENYLTGFCPKGKSCDKAHPQFKLALVHGSFKIVSDEEIIAKRLKNKADYEAKLRLERDLLGIKHEDVENKESESRNIEENGQAGENSQETENPSNESSTPQTISV